MRANESEAVCIAVTPRTSLRLFFIARTGRSSSALVDRRLTAPSTRMLGGRLAPGLLRLAARRPAVPRCAAAAARSLHASRPPCAETVKITFIEEGEEVEVDAEIGKSLLEVAHANEIDLEGACDGSLACSTCHLILTQEVFDSLDPPEEEEEDMLDLAFDLTDTSRLGCQIIVTKELDGMVARIPDGSNDMRPP